MGQKLLPSDLLGWATQHSNQSQPVEQKQLPDSKWLDIILGKQDTQQMKEALEIIASPSEPDCQKLIAFDTLLMLVEAIDNANDIGPIGGYPILLSICSHINKELRMNAFWTLGVIVQNNLKAQLDANKSGVTQIALKGLQDPVQTVSKKALYCLSGILYIKVRNH